MINGLLKEGLTRFLMTMKLKQLLLVCSLVGTQLTGLAQCKEFKWPEPKATAEEKVAIWTDALKSGNYRSATGPIQWMLSVAPQWNTKLYIDGADAYDKLADKETDAAKKKILVDSLIIFYDLRIKNCGDQVNVLNRKASASFKYYQKNKEKLAELLALYDKVYEVSGNNVSNGILLTYMITIKNNQIALKNVTDEQIMARYDKVMAVIDTKMKKSMTENKTQEIEQLKGIKDAIDSELLKMVTVNCDFVKKNLAPKFKQNPSDLALAKKIFKFMLEGKCIDDPLWFEAGEEIFKTEKDFGLGKTLAGKCITAGNYDKAEAIMKEAMPFAKTPQEKSEGNLYLGSIEVKKGNYNGARDLFRQSGSSEAYEKIGDLYYNSFDNCAKKQNVAEDRLVYIAAYEMYQKAGNNGLMTRAKAQFPSREEIFLLNWPVGSAQKVGCWIGETVVLKTRD